MLTLGVGTTAWSTHLHTSNNAQAAQRAVTLAAETITRDVTGRLQLYQYGLRGARGAIVTAGDNLNRDTFHRYSSTRDIAAEFPGARGFGFVRRVPAKDEGVYVANARGEGWPDFTISQLERHDGDRYVIEYIEPVEINRQAVGLDVASETNRRIAAEVSMRTGAATLTGPITLVQASGERLQSFLFMLPIYHADAPTRTTAEREAALFGWSYAPLIMREVLEHIAMDTSRLYMRLRDITDAPDAQPFYETSAPGGNAPELHTQLMTRTVFGRQWEIEISAYPSFISDLNQIPGHFLLSAGLAASLLAAALAAAITVSRQCKQMIDTEQARLATIVENSSDAIVGESLSGIIISWNRAAERLFGYAENEALGRPLAQLLTPGENASGEDADVLERIACGDTVAAFDTVKLRRDGTPIDVSVTAGAIRDAEERLVGVATLMHDIRDRKQKQRRLAEFSARLEREVAERTAELKNVNILLQDMLRAASEVSIIATDTNGIITIFNAGSEKMLGYTAEEMVGKRTPAVLHVPDEIARRAAALNQEYGASIEGFRAFVVKSEHEGSETREWTYVRKDGSTLTVSLIVTTMRDEAGDITGYLGIAEDVTERRRITASLHEAKIAAEAANRAKDQFLAMMSHELRTPLTGIIGMADLLVTTDLKPEQRALLQTQTRSAHTLLDLLNDILDFAKIETGRVELESMNFSVGQIARDIVAVMQPLASERGNVVSVNTDPSVAESYRGDAKRYRQVLMNLVGNAIKFTSKGKIDIVIRAEGTDGSARVETLVSDTGIGIAAVNRDHLFRPFVQEDVSTSRKFGGTGLGLAISKNLVEMMGGEIWVESELGKGSTFGFVVMLNPGDVASTENAGISPETQPSPRDHLPTAPRALRILLAEDNDTTRMLVSAVMARMGHAVTAVENGALAVAETARGSYDVILMDMQMPVMDGPTAMRAIRDGDKAWNRIPIIALTADAVVEHHADYLAAGAGAVVTKPVDWQRLNGAIARLTEAASSEPRPSDVAPAAFHRDQPVLNEKFLEDMQTAIDPALFARLLDSFVTNVQSYTAALSAATGCGDAGAAKRSAHALKGLAVQFGATHLSELARRAEDVAAQGKADDALTRTITAASDDAIAAMADWRLRQVKPALAG